MRYPFTCPDCGAALQRSPHHCTDCDWRPWYRTPSTLGMAVLTVVTTLALAGILVRMGTPLSSLLPFPPDEPEVIAV